MKLTVIGRNPDQVEIVISNEYISNYHAEIIQLDNGDIFITDKSTNGTYLNGIRLPKDKEIQIKYGDDIYFTELKIPLDWSKIKQIKRPKGVIRGIGSHHSNDIVVNRPEVSRFHATVLKTNNGKWYICDHSLNGTTINGKNIPKNRYVQLKQSDRINCAGFQIKNPITTRKKAWSYAVIAAAVIFIAIPVLIFIPLHKPSSSSDELLLSMYGNSVTLMACKYHFEASCGTLAIDDLPDPESWNTQKDIFSSTMYDKFVIAQDNIMRFDGKNSMISTGTGFFTGNDGTVITSRDIARPWEMPLATDKTADDISTMLQVAENHFKAKLIKLYEMGYDEALPYISQLKVHGVYDGMEIRSSGMQDTENDAIECAAIAYSSENENLAVFRTINSVIPDGMRSVPMDKISTTEPEYKARILVIGFGNGTETLSATNINPDTVITNFGKISRDLDRYAFGVNMSKVSSCGSPIFDRHGKLIGILCSGSGTALEGNYGIKSKHIVSILEATKVTR